MKKALMIVLAICISVAGLVGCSQTNGDEPLKDSKTSQTDEPTQSSEPDSTSSGDTAMFKGTSYERALKTLSLIKDKNKNVCISPLSIEMALSLAANGMDDSGRNTIESFLGLNIDDLNANNYEYLNGKQDDETLSIANSVWVKENYSDVINEDFSKDIKDYYKSDIGTFDTSPDKINTWVSENTHGMIPSILDKISENLRAVLVNAVYFDGKWVEPFEEYQVAEEDFTLLDGTTVKANIMTGEVSTYMENAQATAFKKDYENGYSFIGILPKDQDKFDIETFNMHTLLETSTSEYSVLVKIPKFESSFSTSLVDVLTQLGMGDIFRADSMSRILNSDEALGISEVVHKTAIKMNEEGTEASAVTGVMVEMSAMRPEKEEKQVYLNRPFMYAIMDNSSNQILFIGTVNNPLK